MDSSKLSVSCANDRCRLTRQRSAQDGRLTGRRSEVGAGDPSSGARGRVGRAVLSNGR